MVRGMKKTFSICSVVFCLIHLFLVSSEGTAYSQLFVATNDFSGLHNCAILKYDYDGTYLDAILLPNNDVRGLAISGTNLYALCFGLGTVAKYSTSGSTINPALISGLNQPSALAVDGTNLYVADVDYIRKYTTDGTIVNAAFIATPAGNYGLGSYGLTVIGTNLFATYPSGNIAKYTTDGAVVNETLVTGLSSPLSLTTDGTNLYVVNYNDGIQPGWVGEYTAEGSPISAQLIYDAQAGAADLAYDGVNLYVITGAHSTVGKFTTLGITINSALITGGHYFTGIAASPMVQPSPPPTLGITTYSNRPAVFYPANDRINRVIQMTTNLESGDWVTVSNGESISGLIITNAPRSAFFRLQ